MVENLTIVTLKTIIDLRNNKKNGQLLQEDIDKLKSYQNKSYGIGITLNNNFPARLLFGYQLYWGESKYPACSYLITCYTGNMIFWYGFSMGGGFQAIRLDCNTKTWQVVNISYTI